MQDIERIEVLRGSNSAAYGARAVLGVINIVTRHTGDSIGTQVSVTGGENSIRDAQARLGWGREGATYRLTVDRRADAGLEGANGHNKLERINFRADLSPNATDEIQLRTGGMSITSGRGLLDINSKSYIGNPLRDSSFGASYAHLDWRRSLGEDADLAFSASHTREFYRDSFPYDLRVFGINDIYIVGLGGRATNNTVSLQHTFRQGPGLRVVWGGEFRREQVESLPLYNTTAAFRTDFTRLFGNAEWRIRPDLVLNAGAMAERSSDSGDSVAPRVMLNWHLAPGQTLRAGVSRGYRPPSTLEMYADVRYVYAGKLLDVSVLPSGNLKPESVLARELGYMLDAPHLGIGLDVRVFHEQMTGIIEQINSSRKAPKTYANSGDFGIRGLEYQLKWRPWRGGELNFNQAFFDIGSPDLGTEYAAPKRASTLVISQTLPNGVELTLLHQNTSKFTPQATQTGEVFARKRTDIRLSAPLQVGRHRGELAMVVQNVGAPYPDLRPMFTFERQAFMTLTFEN
jgi:iron complex outermembrane receptor protein